MSGLRRKKTTTINSTAVSRIKRDYFHLKNHPIPYITAEPLPSNLLEWHYVAKGPNDTPYQGGYYHGKLLFPREYPFKPPAIYMLTPNGRFKINTPLCLSISDYHPSTWNPTWSVGTILAGLLSFMLEDTPTRGSVETLTYEKQQYATKSLTFNLKNSNFRELFPQICEEIECQLKNLENANNSATTDETASDIEYLAENEDDGNDISYNKIDRIQYIKKNWNWHKYYSNAMLIFCFSIFAFIVNYVINDLK